MGITQTLSGHSPANEGDRPQALILAAGRGSRLNGAAEQRPKCLAEVGGQSLLRHQLATLAAHGIRDVCVVVGYEADSVREHCGGVATFIENRRWAHTNSLYSFWLAREWIERDVVVLNCDVLSHPGVVTRVLGSRRSTLAYDSTSGADAEHMKVHFADGCLQLMSKTLSQPLVHGENVGILFFERAHTRRLLDEARQALREGGERCWLAEAVQRTAQAVPLEGVDVGDLPWIEIDFPEDLAGARERVWPAIEHAAAALTPRHGALGHITGDPAQEAV